MLGFLRVEGWRAFDGANSAETAAPRALLAGDHERGIAAGPAFVNVWAAGLFAHRVKPIVFDRRFGGVKRGLLGAAWQAGSEPIWESALGSSGR